MEHTRLKRSEMNCEPLSESKRLGAPYLKIHSLTNEIETSRALIYLSGTACVSLVNRSVINKMKV